jgi:glycosyltransferase involved in cell wall biosynthesis
VVIPCYKSPNSLRNLVERISTELQLSKLVGSYEIVLVNDGSPDNLQEAIRAISRKNPKVRWIQLTRNYGQHIALLVGCRAARYDFILTMDDDGQHIPESLPALLGKLERDVDVVYGVPASLPHSWFRNYSSKFLKSIVFSLLGVKNANHISALRLFRRQIISGYLADANFTGAVVDVVLDWTTTKKEFVSVQMQPAAEGRSRYTTNSLFKLAMQMMTTLSSRPLRLATLTGFISAVASLIVGISFIVLYLSGAILVPGFASLVVLMTFFGAVHLMFLGLLGEYVLTLKDRAIGKPTYVVRDHN